MLGGLQGHRPEHPFVTRIQPVPYTEAYQVQPEEQSGAKVVVVVVAQSQGIIVVVVAHGPVAVTWPAPQYVNVQSPVWTPQNAG